MLVSCSWLDNKDLNGEIVPELKQHMVTMAVNCEKFDAHGKLKDNQKLDSKSCLIFDNSNAIENLPDDIKVQFQTILDCGNGNLSSFYPDKKDYGEEVKRFICFFCARESYIQMSEEEGISIGDHNKIKSIIGEITKSIKQKYTDLGLIKAAPHAVETQNQLCPQTPRSTSELKKGVFDRVFPNSFILNSIPKEDGNVQQVPLPNYESTEHGTQDEQTVDQKQTKTTYQEKSEKDWQKFFSYHKNWGATTEKSRNCSTFWF